jgi:hypothetical protein
VVRPDPIPNSAVKHSLADGSGSIGSARVGCRQIFPKTPFRIPNAERRFAFLCSLRCVAPQRGDQVRITSKGGSEQAWRGAERNVVGRMLLRTLPLPVGNEK